MKWISIEDELPEIEKTVLVYCFHEYYDGKDHFIDMGYRNQSGIYDVHGSPVQPEITHWMALPEIPKN